MPSEPKIAILRDRVRDRHCAYLFAKAYVDEIQHEINQWGDLPRPDGGFRMQNAQRHETETLRRYREAVHALADAIRAADDKATAAG